MKANYNPNSVRQEAARTAVCDQGCGVEFNLVVREEVIPDVPGFGVIRRKYLQCPECAKQYTIGFADEAVQALLDENNRLFNESKEQLLHRKITRREFDTVQRKIAKNKRKGLDRMDKIERAWNTMKRHEH